MRRLVHISDLHFGREQPELLEPLRQAIDAEQADLVAVTGDLTQRARRRQFRQARAFLDGLAAPWICVPGNHDVPLDKLWDRWFRPFKRYREIVSSDLTPVHEDAELLVVGLNTVDPFSWQRGKIRGRALRDACQRFAERDGVKVVLAHHPFQQSPETKKSLMRNAHSALTRLSDCGAQLVLSGHLHRWLAEPFLTEERESNLLQVHVGTGLSSRLRGQENDFAVLTLDPGAVEVRRMVAESGRFVCRSKDAYVQGPTGWQRV
ncbi:MAG TPA: phosphodiesterase [Rhodobacteraceae bacterium]|nr:phosphodiesterase [Paracoccaceae bacterium]